MNSDQTHRSPPPIKIVKSSSGSLRKTAPSHLPHPQSCPASCLNRNLPSLSCTHIRFREHLHTNTDLQGVGLSEPTIPTHHPRNRCIFHQVLCNIRRERKKREPIISYRYLHLFHFRLVVITVLTGFHIKDQISWWITTTKVISHCVGN